MEECLSYLAFPEPHRRRIRTTNGLERFNQELRKCTRVVRIFPNPTLGREREEARSMARSGEEIHNPIQGDSILFRQTTRDTGGELMSGELVVSPGGGNPLHVHPLQEEHFEVLSGTLGVQIGDEHRSLGQGQEATVPPVTPHRWFNDSDREEARVLGEVRPALNSEVFFETLYGLARDGRTDESGVPNLLQFAVMLNGLHKGEIYLAEPPIALQKALFALLSPAGKLLGYRDHYPRYSAPETLSGEGAGPPSTTSVMARAVAIAASLVIASLLLVGRTRRSEG